VCIHDAGAERVLGSGRADEARKAREGDRYHDDRYVT
jgi:hypothetical protein